MQIQLEQIDYEMLRRGSGKLTVPFKACFGNKNTGELLVLGSGVAYFELIEGMADELFSEIQHL